MITLGGWTGRNVLGNGRFGYRPDEFATLGDFDSPLADDADLPADASTEFVWVLKGSLPSSGTLVCNDDGGMSHTGAADGSYTTLYDLYTWAPGGGVTSEGEGSFTNNFGVVVTTIAGTVAEATASGLAAAIDAHTLVDGTVGSATASGLQASLDLHTVIAASVASAAASGLDAAVTSAGATAISAEVGTATASGLAAVVNASTAVAAGVAAAAAEGLAAEILVRVLIEAGSGDATATGLQADIAAISTAPVQPEIAVGPGGASTKRRPTREQIELQEQEDEAFEVVMKHLKEPHGNHDAELQEVLEVVMALAAAGVLD